jgi:hypothetical protein
MHRCLQIWWDCNQKSFRLAWRNLRWLGKAGEVWTGAAFPVILYFELVEAEKLPNRIVSCRAPAHKHFASTAPSVQRVETASVQ